MTTTRIPRTYTLTLPESPLGWPAEAKITNGTYRQVARDFGTFLDDGCSRAAFALPDGRVLKLVKWPEYKNQYGTAQMWHELNVWRRAVREGWADGLARIYAGTNLWAVQDKAEPLDGWLYADYEQRKSVLFDVQRWAADHGLIDCHSANVGWLDGRVVVFDYGFRGWQPRDNRQGTTTYNRIDDGDWTL